MTKPDSPHPDAARVAQLAKIELDPQQVELIGQQLDDILAYVGQLQEVDLPEGTEPFFGSHCDHQPLREDQVRPSLSPEEALANAPDTDGQYYRVPPVFGS